MNIIKSFIASIIAFSLILFVIGSYSNASIGSLLGILGIAIFYALLVVVWAYAAYLLLDSGKWYYELFSVLMTGIFGIVVLIGIRWVYRKMNLHFLD